MTLESEFLLARVQAATEGEYRIERELGRGGMAAVFLARDIALERRVAIKVMLPDLMSVAGVQDRFVVEARTVAHLDHAGIVTVYSVKQRDDLTFIVMKYIDGRTLDAIMKDRRDVSLPVLASIIGQVAEALHFAHTEGIVHRDVKPSNIIVDTRGRPFVTDFGIAKVTSARSITLTGSMIGTPAYMSPEQCRGLPATAASDQYALGVMAYETIAGVLPFDGSIFELIHAHSNELPRSLEEAVPGIDPRVARTVHKMLEKTPRDRHASLAEVGAFFLHLAASGQDGAAVRASLASLAAGAPSETSDDPQQATPTEISSQETERIVTPAPILVITPAEPNLEVGESIQLRVSESSGASLAGVRVSWRSEDPSIAAVDETGLVTALSVGVAKVTAAGGTATGHAVIDVRAARAERVVVTPQAPELTVDESAQFVATVLDRRGTILKDRAIVWTSSDITVCAVSQEGRATAVSAGRVSVTALCGEVQGSASVKVRAAPVRRVVVTPGEASIEHESTLRLTAAVLGPDDRELTGRTIRWRSSAPLVVEVSKDGTILGSAPGTAAVIAECEGSEGIASISVRSQPVVAIRIQPAQLRLEVGRSLQLQGVGEDRRGRARKDGVIGWSSADEHIAIIDAAGKIHGVAEGHTQVRAALGEATSLIEVTVIPRAVAQVRLSPTAPRLEVGQSLQMETTSYDADGGVLEGRTATWASSDVSVVAVTSDGHCDAKAAGSARITATIGEVRASATIKVQRAAAVTPPVAQLPNTAAASAPMPTVAAPASVAAPRRRGLSARKTLAIGAVAVVGAGLLWSAMSNPIATTVPAAIGPSIAPTAAVPVPAAPPIDSTPIVATAVPSAPPTRPQSSSPVRQNTRRQEAPPPSAPTTSASTQDTSNRSTSGVAQRPDSSPAQPVRAESTANPPLAAPPVTSAPSTAPPRADPVVTENLVPAPAGPPADAVLTALCGDAALAERALTDALRPGVLISLNTLYRAANVADGRAKLDLLAPLRNASAVRAEVRGVSGARDGEGCAWTMQVTLSYSNAFNQPRRRAGQLRAVVGVEGGVTTVRRVFGATGF